MKLTQLLLGVTLVSLTATAEEAVRIELPHAPGVHLAGVIQRPDPGPVEYALLLLPPAGPADADLSLGSRGIYRALVPPSTRSSPS